MGWFRQLWRSWFQGFYDQVEHQSDSEVLIAYEDAKQSHGAGSREVTSLEPRVREIKARRGET
jgi:hypothetical protein